MRHTDKSRKRASTCFDFQYADSILHYMSWDAEDGNGTEYGGELFQYSLTPRTNTKYMTTIEPCHGQ